MNNRIVTVLCSGVAMGVYTPALAVRHQLENNKIDTDVVVLESLYLEDKRNKINDTKKVFHKDFRIAKKAHEMAKDITPSLDKELVNELFANWRDQERQHFIVFSGFWMPILMKYREFVHPQKVYADLVIVDSVISPSWKSYKGEIPENFEIQRLFNCDEGRITQKIFTPKNPPPSFKEKEDRLVIHGGGWGMGNYQSIIPELNERGIGLNIVMYFKEDNFTKNIKNRYYMIDPSWRPWHKNKQGRVEFPPFGEIYRESGEVYSNREEYNELFYIIAGCKGVISKPGGCTLVESLASATPIIFLDPLGEHEEKNAELWINLGFGIAYEDWKNSGFSFDTLERLHNNLLIARNIEFDYVNSYIKKISIVNLCAN
ncbi:MAG: UDP-glucuronosyltransferase [Bacillota bacterium]|nr:UDP-glucuronosyltransferase [Bacillota bacterium]